MSKVTTRMCLSCRKRAPKNELLRFRWLNGLVRDFEGNKGGRGVYLHDDDRCLKKPAEVGKWRKALRLEENSVITLADINAAILSNE